MFSIGDRVVVNGYNGFWEDINGKTATVLFIDRDKTYALCFDEFVYGHDCYGNCASGYGLFVRDKHLSLLKAPTRRELSECEIEALLDFYCEIMGIPND